jgi:hypothetical protein
MDEVRMGAQLEDKDIEDRDIETRSIESLEIEDEALEARDLEEKLADSLADLVPEAQTVSEDEFAEVVGGALEAVGGRLLFKMRLDRDGQGEHVAAASVGDGGERQFLLLNLPAKGGALKVEAASKSRNPVAALAASYAGLMDVFPAAA